MSVKVALGLFLGFVIGFGCAFFSIPVPAPPVLIGALLVVAMTSGYILADKYICPLKANAQAKNCGGPSGE
ncbi:DUF1427 family protein [Curvivirga aplysinae]|uniref:DUF1427 family protein n=1 Tax=Curvivirga aplysinae TaxID=2529852 RepID=UPI0012BD0A93|nr:DUF1427 family protein [Curvivirga aplysinae]MTI09940.1 XapX domain-containing protein [Curvivirga aplysinae]